MSETDVNIPSELHQDVKSWDVDDVEKFLTVNKEKYRLKDSHIQAIKKQEIDGRSLLSLTYQEFRECGIPIGPAKRIVILIDELKIVKLGK